MLFDGSAFLAGMFAVGVAVGTIESTMARFRLLRIPQLLVGAAAISTVGIFLTLK